MTLWTGFKQLHSAFDETIGPNEEEEANSARTALSSRNLGDLTFIYRQLLKFLMNLFTK